MTCVKSDGVSTGIPTSDVGGTRSGRDCNGFVRDWSAREYVLPRTDPAFCEDAADAEVDPRGRAGRARADGLRRVAAAQPAPEEAAGHAGEEVRAARGQGCADGGDVLANAARRKLGAPAARQRGANDPGLPAHA